MLLRGHVCLCFWKHEYFITSIMGTKLVKQLMDASGANHIVNKWCK